jgi:hypothetical protein
MALLFGNVSCIARDVEKAASLVLPLADAGFPPAQAVAGFIYSAGLGVNSSQAKYCSAVHCVASTYRL